MTDFLRTSLVPTNSSSLRRTSRAKPVNALTWWGPTPDRAAAGRLVAT